MNSICVSNSHQFSIEYFHQVRLLLKPNNLGYLVIAPVEYGLLWIVSLGKPIGLLTNWFPAIWEIPGFGGISSQVKIMLGQH